MKLWPYWGAVGLIVLFYAACSAQGQDFSVTFRPMPMRASEALLGGKEYGLWTAEVAWINSLTVPRQLTRKEILDLGMVEGRPIPFIADATLAADLIENRVYLSKPAKIGRWLAVVDKYAGPGLALAGYATGVGELTVIGLSYQGIKTAREMASGREPKPEDVVRALMPPVVVLAGGQAVHVLLSAKMPNARAVLDVRQTIDGPEKQTALTEASAAPSARGFDSQPTTFERTGLDHVPPDEATSAYRMGVILRARRDIFP